MAVARPQHQPVLAEGDGRRIAIGGGVADGEKLHGAIIASNRAGGNGRASPSFRREAQIWESTRRDFGAHQRGGVGCSLNANSAPRHAVLRRAACALPRPADLPARRTAPWPAAALYSSRSLICAIDAPRIRSLICTSPLAFSSPPWMTAQGAPRLSAYFICAPNLPDAEIKLGADAGAAQRRDHLLVVGDAILIEHRHDHRAGFGLRVDLLQVLQRRHQARHADRDAGRRHMFAAEAPDQAVIAPAARDRAEAHRLAVLAFDREGQLNLEHRAGVIFEAADDGGIDADARLVVARRRHQLAIAASSSTLSVSAYAVR